MTKADYTYQLRPLPEHRFTRVVVVGEWTCACACGETFMGVGQVLHALKAHGAAAALAECIRLRQALGNELDEGMRNLNAD